MILLSTPLFSHWSIPLKVPKREKLVVVAFGPRCMPTMCLRKILKFWFCYECLKILIRIHFFVKTQYAGEIFCRSLSMRLVIFADLANISDISCDNSPFLSKSFDKYCHRYKAVKKVTFLVT
jgi:hypothetical protein